MNPAFLRHQKGYDSVPLDMDRLRADEAAMNFRDKLLPVPKHDFTRYDKKQLRMGIKVEMEHTNDAKIAEKIAKDHLREFPDYYTHLLKMEKELKSR